MLASSSQRAGAGAGLLVGLALAALLLSGWRVEAGDGHVRIRVRFLANPTGELGVTPAGPFLTLGASPRGRLVIRNQTGAAMRVRLRARAPEAGLRRGLRIHILSKRRTLFRGTLAGLDRWTATSLRLRRQRSTVLVVTVRVPRRARGRIGGGSQDVTFELRATPAGRRAS